MNWTTHWRRRLTSAPSRNPLMSGRYVLALLLSLGSAQICLGQTAEQTKKTVLGKDCAGINFQKEGYTVKSSHIDDPFAFLPWVKIREQRAASEISDLVDGQPFRYDTAVTQALDIIDKENFLPDTSEVRVRIRLEFVSVENCSGGHLDLLYRVYSTQIRPVLNSVPEARVTERQAPQTTAGLSSAIVPSNNPVRLTPTAGYDSTDKLSGGGRLEITPEHLWKLPFNSIIIEGQGSSAMRSISAALFGSTDSVGWLAYSEWRLNYSHYSLPTGSGELSGGHLSVQFSGLTKPLAHGNMTARFGGVLEGGNRQSALRDLRLAPDTMSSAAFGALKLYAGLNSRLPHNVLSASYGLELGAVGPAARVDWRKHIGDIRHEFWYTLGEHRLLSLESRLTAGSIQIPGMIPLSERFFGGNYEKLFIPGDSWQIREGPVIRAIAGSKFYRTADGDGGDRFFSYNLTAAYALWGQPLVPVELSKGSQVRELIQGQITSATSIEQIHYLTKDPHYVNLATQLPAVQSALGDLKVAVAAAQGARPGQFTAQFKACTGAITMATLRAKRAAQSKDVKQYDPLTSLLSISGDDENRLAKVSQACLTDLNGALGGDQAIAVASASLEGVRSQMEGELSKIDQRRAESQAKADMAFTQRTLDTLFNEVNIYSVSPVFVFDVAKLGTEMGRIGGVRYGPGVGLRLELASVVHFTAGYAWNIRQGPGEGSGAIFFSLGLRDLFH